MPDSPQNSNWYTKPHWLVIGSAIGWTFATSLWALVVHWDKVEAHVPRMLNRAAGLWKSAPPPAPAPAPQAVVEAPKPPPPPKPTVAPLRNSDDMREMLRSLPDDNWEAKFNAHFRNRETAMVLVLTEVVDGRLKFEGDFTRDNWRPTYIVTPKNKADLKRFKPGVRLLIEGDLEKFRDTGPGRPDEVTIARARLTESKEPDGMVTGSVKR